MISKLNTQKPNTKRKLCTSEKLSMSDKKRSWLNQKGQGGSPTLKLSIFPYAPFVPTLLFPIMHPGGEVNFRKRGSKFSLPLSHRHQNPSCNLEGSEVYKGRCTFSFQHPPPPSPPHIHTHAPNPWYTLEWKSSLHKGVYMLSSREWLEERGQVSKETVVLRRWGI